LAKYHYEHPWGSFTEWLERLELRYDNDNAKSKQFWAEFSRDPKKQAKILAGRLLRREMKRILDMEHPYTPARGLLEPKPEPSTKSLTLNVLHIIFKETLFPNETHDGLRSFSGPEFEAYLRKTAEEIVDRAVRMVIEDVERTIFEEEKSSVTM